MNWIFALLAGIALGAAGLFSYLKMTADQKLLNTRTNVEKLLEGAQKEAATLKKEAALEAQEEVYNQKQVLEAEIEAKRTELNQAERDLDKREVDVDRKAEFVEKKEKELDQFEQELLDKEDELKNKGDELNRLMIAEVQKLEHISGLSRDEAKQLLMKDFEDEAREEGERAAQMILEESRIEAHRRARQLIVQAIQQTAAEQSVEATISIITLPSDDMKGRIIGREGRNIRSFELVTGVDVIIDDTPEIVVLSSYNSFRRETAKICLEKLITDGRIHPARIEEVFAKTSEEMTESLREIGEETLLEMGVHGVASDVAQVLGRLKYRTGFGQNVLEHSIEVATLSGIIAAELELDVKLAKRAAILHDIGKGLDNYTEANHAKLGADFLKKYDEKEVVINTALSHHNERDAQTPLALIVAAANRISGTRPGARRESLELFIKRMQHLEKIAEEFDGVSKAYAIQAGREVRVIVETEKVDDSHARQFARDIAKNIQRKLEFPGQIKVTVIREYRAYEFAT